MFGLKNPLKTTMLALYLTSRLTGNAEDLPVEIVGDQNPNADVDVDFVGYEAGGEKGVVGVVGADSFLDVLDGVVKVAAEKGKGKSNKFIASSGGNPVPEYRVSGLTAALMRLGKRGPKPAELPKPSDLTVQIPNSDWMHWTTTEKTLIASATVALLSFGVLCGIPICKNKREKMRQRIILETFQTSLSKELNPLVDLKFSIEEGAIIIEPQNNSKTVNLHLENDNATLGTHHFLKNLKEELARCKYPKANITVTGNRLILENLVDVDFQGVSCIQTKRLMKNCKKVNHERVEPSKVAESNATTGSTEQKDKDLLTLYNLNRARSDGSQTAPTVRSTPLVRSKKT